MHHIGVGTMLLVLLAATILSFAAMFWAGHGFSRSLVKRSPNSLFAKRVGPIQALSAAFLASVLMIGTAVRELAPTSTLGKLLHSPFGLFTGLILTWILYVGFAVGLTLLRRRFAQRRGGA